MSLHRLGIIGAGGIAELALTSLTNGLRAPLDHVSILVPAAFETQAKDLLARFGTKLTKGSSVHTTVAPFLAERPDVVAECASHVAVRDFGPTILEAGCDLIVISIGSLADATIHAALEKAAATGNGRLILPAGAIGGIDALAAARLSGLEEVIYTGRKPPKAWRGTAAEQLLDLDSLKEPTTFFEGSAGKAAQDYPFNANVAATLALAGMGLEKTKVKLVADPTVSRNVHEFSVRAGCGDFSVRLEGRPSAANPKTSQMAGYSVGRELLNRAGTVVI
jgi:aspartate dehydrogenase